MTTFAGKSTFPKVRKGYDPSAVDEHIAHLQRVHRDEMAILRKESTDLQQRLDAATEQQEAVHLTLVAVGKAKEELLAQAGRSRDEVATAARAEAEEILNQARLDALRLVSEAREGGDLLLTEAKAAAEKAVPDVTARTQRLLEEAEDRASQLLANAEGERVALIAGARTEAENTVEAARQEAAAVREEPVEPHPQETAAFEAESEQLRARITHLEREVADLEVQRQTAADRVATTNGHVETSLPPRERLARTTNAEASPIVEDAVADIERPPPSPPESPVERAIIAAEEEETPVPERANFYTRRSAKLPRIGDGAGRDALAAMNGLRAQITMAAASDGAEDGEEDSHRQTDDLAVQTA